MLKNLLICAFAVTGVILSFSIGALTKSETGNYVTSNEIQTSEQAKTERKYFRRRKKRLKRWNFDVDGFLERYGYLKNIPYLASEGKYLYHDKFERKEAIRLFQEFYGLKQTGRINKKAVKIMQEPRCGLPDTRLSDPMSTIRDFHVYHYYPRWRRAVLTWKASRYTLKISPLRLWKTIRKAFETWSAVSGLRFIYTRQTPDIEVRFEKKNHGDGRTVAFDGKAGVAAHAFGPGEYAISGDVHLDEEEDWTLSVNRKDGTNLLAVLIHEIGHTLGLPHSKDPTSVMHPAFVAAKLDLNVDDIENVQILYGPNPTEKSGPSVYKIATTPAPKICKVNMDDIDLGPDGYGYIFKGPLLRQIDKRGKIEKTKNKLHIWDRYTGGPRHVDAVAYHLERRRTYMFSNNTIWRFTNFNLDLGYPKNVSDMPEIPRAAAFVRDQYGITRLLIYGVERFWEWSTSRDQVAKGYPLNTTQYFEGLPKAPIGAVRWKDGYIYFFKAEKVYKVHPASYKVMRGYPRPMPPDWMKGIC